MSKPCIFIGSSSEGLEIARKIRSQITDLAEVTIWHEGPFGLSKGLLDSLVSAAQHFDFAILVLTQDDLVSSRGSTEHGPRDNVLFECGLFMGRLGPDRTFLVYDIDQPPKLPSDLAGISVACYHGKRDDTNLMAAVGPACDPIRDAISELGPRRGILPAEISLGKGRIIFTEDSRGWLRPLQLRNLKDGVSVRLGSTELNVRYGSIQDAPADDATAVVLPANEFFDDECVNDARSALGAFVQAVFPGQITELQKLVRENLRSVATTSVEKRPGLIQESYSVGTCVFIDRPLQSEYRLILAAVTTERSGIGLRSELSFLLKALKQAVTVGVSNRLSHMYMPLLGAGHGGLRPEVSLFGIILGLAEILWPAGRKLESVNIIVFRNPRGDSETLSIPVIEQIMSTAAGMFS